MRTVKSLRETLVPGVPLTVEAFFHDLPDAADVGDCYVVWFHPDGNTVVQDTVVIKTPDWKPRTTDGKPVLATFILPTDDASAGHPWATKGDVEGVEPDSVEEESEEDETEE